MGVPEIIAFTAALFALGAFIFSLMAYIKAGEERKEGRRELAELSEVFKRSVGALADELRNSKNDIIQTVKSGDEMQSRMTTQNLNAITQVQDSRLRDINAQQESLTRSIQAMIGGSDERFAVFAASNETRLEGIRAAVDKRLSEIQTDNTRQLEAIRKTVDEKLQETLENRITQSFKLVSERLEQVYRGLGEMQGLAAGVGDLKKVLSNVKTRGILGELQLGAILGEILSPEQYDENVQTIPKSPNRVEYAIKLPGDGNGTIYLPIDAKFPADAYSSLVDAYEGGNQEEINAAGNILVARIKANAKDIRDKYVEPPFTTDFAVMFLPFEGLYAEVVRRGMIEVLQKDYKVNVAGPSTMAALLNSLQLGFRNLAIQKRSAEVWEVLLSVKTEFEKFSDALSLTDQRLSQAQSELDKLIGVRTRQIQRKLDKITAPEESNPTLPGV